jgi:hypothetical protein
MVVVQTTIPATVAIDFKEDCFGCIDLTTSLASLAGDCGKLITVQ